MKSYTIILLLVCLISLGQITDARRHKHGRHHSSSTTLTLRSCASKLDFLCLGRLYTQLENYKNNVTSIIRNLQLRTEERIDEFENARLQAEIATRLTILQNAIDLENQIVVITLTTAADNSSCARALETDVQQYRDTLLTMVSTCVANSSLDRYAVKTSINNLKNQSLAAEDKLCDCVENIHICSRKSEKQTAKGCAEAAAATLNYDLVQQQAEIIYNQVDTQATTALVNFNACLTNIPVQVNKDTLAAEIQACTLP